jgi:hypothetical protein
MLLKKEERQIADNHSGGASRWEHVKRQAADNIVASRVPGLRMTVDEQSRTVTLTDGKLTRTVGAGQDVWFDVANWPGSKLREAEGISPLPASEMKEMFGALRDHHLAATPPAPPANRAAPKHAKKSAKK